MRNVSLALCLLVAAGCKQRNPDAAGLLDADEADDGEAQAEPPAYGPGDWRIACKPAESAASRDAYDLIVRGAVHAEDEVQPVTVTVERRRANASQQVDRLSVNQAGRGTVRETGISLGFGAGALTADFDRASKEYSGILTLAEDAQAKALAVRCVATKLN